MTLPPMPPPSYLDPDTYAGRYTAEQMRDYATAAKLEEREAIAAMCDGMIAEWPHQTSTAYDAGRITGLRNVADAIRARTD